MSGHEGEPVVEIRFRRLPGSEDLAAPTRATPRSSGHDLRACIDGELVLAPLERSSVPTGIALELPQGFEGQVRPRSGLARRHGLTLTNAPGTIDSDYRGEVCVLLINLGREPVTITRGERIAQLVVTRLPQVEWSEVGELSSTRRGAGGFGHTGKH